MARNLDTVSKIFNAYKNKTGRQRLSLDEKKEILSKNQKKIADELRRYGPDTPEGAKLRRNLERELEVKFKIEENTTGPINTFFEMSAWLQSIELLYGEKINTAGGGPSTIEELRDNIHFRINSLRRIVRAKNKPANSDPCYCSIRFVVDESGLFAPRLEFATVQQ